MTITVHLNDALQHLEGAPSLGEALPGWGYEGRGFVVAVNGEFVPRSGYGARVLHDGDRVDVLKPMSGG